MCTPMLHKTANHERILGIDPGYDRLGYAVIEHGLHKPHVVASGCILTDKKDSHDARLLSLGAALIPIIETYTPTAAALETLLFSTNQKTAIKVAEARGVITYEMAKAGIPVFEFNPMTIKVTVTGYGKSDKTQVMAMIPRIVTFAAQSELSQKKKMLDDEFDAIAIGVTCLVSYPHLMRQKSLLQK